MMILRKLARALVPSYVKSFRGSEDYWRKRYRFGGHSGAGSRGAEARFKADQVDRACREREIASVVELGCGDGQNASLLAARRYLGLDISDIALAHAQLRCRGRDGFAFQEIRGLAPEAIEGLVRRRMGGLPDLALSMDVIFHLVEDDVFDRYLDSLARISARYVAVYSTDEDEPALAHVRHRRFSSALAGRHALRLLDRRDGFNGKNFFLFEHVRPPALVES